MKELLKLFFLIYLISQILCQCPENCDCEEGETKCIKCHNEEFYGDSCDQPCNETTNCEKCQIDGTCYKCEGNKFKGPNCAEACNENCPSGECKFDDGVCEDGDCKDYLTYGDECNIPCSNINESCVECYRQGTCKSCSEDYHGIYCNITCPGCPQKQCDDNGVCEDKDGNCENEEYYGVNCEFTCKNIDPNCKKCNRNGICILCEEQLFGPKCEGNCSVCPNGLCDNNGECQDQYNNCKDNATYGRNCQEPCSKIGENCEECSRDETCILCKNKAYFGKECNTPCYCPGQICEADGTCDDPESDCFNKIFFGTKCDEQCNEGRDNCVECHRNGDCFTCTNETYFGRDCNDKCDSCPDKKCDITGKCSDDEKDCINKTFYGDYCNETCNNLYPRCEECHRNQICIRCNDASYFGPKCDEFCKLCPENHCENDGRCINQDQNCYENETYGVYCNETCTNIDDNCIKCDREGVCIECFESKYYGPDCKQFCSNCPNNKCKINGDCEESDSPCNDQHFYGNNCSIPCNLTNQNCDTCDKNGICLSCYNKEKYGDKCETPCEYCPDNLCEIDGNCTDQSKDCFESKYYGVKCDQICSELNENCLLCNRQEDCFECSNKTYYGDRCNKLCDNCPGKTCNNSGICNDTTSNCEDPTYTGSNCTQKCSDEYINCDKCDRNNICFECKSEIIYGKTCEDTCEQCPDEKEEKGCNIDGICKDDISPCKNKSFTGENCTDFCWEKYDNCFECDRSNICSECKNKTKYGPKCEDSCEECPGESGCYIDGTCIDKDTACKNHSLTGENCTEYCWEKYENCFECERDNTCTKCKSKKIYGNNCTDSCEDCPGEEGCYMNGTCVDQINICNDNTKTGEKCDTPCDEIHNNTKRCDRDYLAIECIDKMFYGNYCNDSCANCPGEPGFCYINGTCMNSDDKCDNDTLTGDGCDILCSSIYSNTLRCDRKYNAIECINKTFYGEHCDKSCSNCPGNCTLDGICEDNITDCDDNTLTGQSCNTSCKDIYNNTKKCHRNYIAIECIDQMFYGNYCNDSCANCPGEPGFCDIYGNCLDSTETCDNDSYTGEKCDTPCKDIYNNTKRCYRNYLAIECIDKMFYGNYCNDSCANCPGDPGFCDINGICMNSNETCDNDSYTGEKCDTQCNMLYNNIKRCDRNYLAIECIDQMFYGNYCNISCANCPGEPGFCDIYGNCLNSTETCDNDSYTGERCDTPCDEIHNNTKRCYRNYLAIECIDKMFYGNYCNDSCANCPGEPGFCDINGICMNSNDTCDNDSYTGEKCDILCNTINNNTLRCYRNYTAIECINQTFYGDYCNDSCSNCPGNCTLDGICEDNSTDCDDTTFTGEKCSTKCNKIYNNTERCHRNYLAIECIDKTFYGIYCDDSCANCPGDPGFCDINGTCYNLNETCDNSTFTGEKCDILCNTIFNNTKRCDRNYLAIECIDQMFYGNYCNDSCANCPGDPGFCDIYGNCLNSTETCDNDSYTGERCDTPCDEIHNNTKRCYRNYLAIECIDKMFYGNYCNDSCANCPGDPGYCDINGICMNSNETCDDNTLSGERCDTPCTKMYYNTYRCDRSYISIECINKTFYGDYCNESCANCPGNCTLDGICEDNSTDCDDTTFTGEKCTTKCNSIYNNTLRCHRNYTAIECINQTFYGDYCNDSCANCPGNCTLDGVCDDSSTNCVNDSYTGSKCDEPCLSLHNNSLRCDRKGISIECLNTSYYGDYCTDECFNCPKNQGNLGVCYINGTCNDSISLCDNDSFTGEKCDEPCNNESVVGNNCYRCNRNKKCLECINKTYYGDYCTDECFNCPGNPGFCYLNGTCEDNSSLCDDDTYYGAGCNISCTKIGLYCKRCNREEKCTECNDTRYHGDKCIEGCDGCSENGCDIQGYCREFECKNGTFGLGCDQNCSCSENSDSLNCGKFGGQCLNCKFGYYGKECADTCTYKCQSKICCIFKQHEKDIESKLELNTNYKYMTIEYNEKKYKIEIDYNYGYPLTLFNESAIYVDCDENSFNKTNIQDSEEKRDIYSEIFTNYDIESHIYKHKKILIEGHKIEVDLTIATKVVCKSKSTSNDISGVIGLGFFNSISNSFFMEGSEKYDLNILSYLYYKENNTVKFNFGNMFEEQIDYIERLTSCDVILDTESDIQGKKMKCKLDGIKSAKYSEGYELINASITFSLGEKSSLVLCKGSGYNYLKNVYLKDINCKEQKNNGITSFYCPKDKIHKLSNFGFVFNKFFYSYSPDKFFDGAGDEQKFLVQINDNLTETEFIIGKEFFENIKFTINNEEAKIYFYARNAEISEVLTQKDSSDDFGIHLEARELAGVTLAIIIFLNFAGFGIYYLVKRRKMKSGDYIRIE